MQAKNKQLAFMTGIQDKSIQIKGNPALVIWFQGLTKYLKPKRAKPKAEVCQLDRVAFIASRLAPTGII
jgi:hypothetical protein